MKISIIKEIGKVINTAGLKEIKKILSIVAEWLNIDWVLPADEIVVLIGLSSICAASDENGDKKSTSRSPVDSHLNEIFMFRKIISR